MSEEDKKADKEHETGYNENESLGSGDEESSIITGETNDNNEGGKKNDDESSDSGDNMTAEEVAHILNNDAWITFQRGGGEFKNIRDEVVPYNIQ